MNAPVFCHTLLHRGIIHACHYHKRYHIIALFSVTVLNSKWVYKHACFTIKGIGYICIVIYPLNPCADEPIPNISYSFYSETCLCVLTPTSLTLRHKQPSGYDTDYSNGKHAHLPVMHTCMGSKWQLSFTCANTE